MNPQPTTNTTATTTSLRELVMGRVDQRWEDWAREHPHLAQTIDRMKLIDSAVQRLRSDPEFQLALRQADLDESKLKAAAQVIEIIERWIKRVLL